MSITEKIRQIKVLREQKNLAIRAEYNSTRPMKTDLGEIAQLHQRFLEVADPKCKDNMKIFILIVFFMYSPVSLLNKRIMRGAIRQEIAKVLGLTRSAVTMYFSDAKSLMFNHKGFKNKAESVFELLQQVM